MMTRFGKTVDAALAASSLNQQERAAAVAAVEVLAELIATSPPPLVEWIEGTMREGHGTAAWKILAWAAKDVHAVRDGRKR